MQGAEAQWRQDRHGAWNVLHSKSERRIRGAGGRGDREEKGMREKGGKKENGGER